MSWIQHCAVAIGQQTSLDSLKPAILIMQQMSNNLSLHCSSLSIEDVTQRIEEGVDVESKKKIDSQG